MLSHTTLLFFQHVVIGAVDDIIGCFRCRCLQLLWATGILWLVPLLPLISERLIYTYSVRLQASLPRATVDEYSSSFKIRELLYIAIEEQVLVSRFQLKIFYFWTKAVTCKIDIAILRCFIIHTGVLKKAKIKELY